MSAGQRAFIISCCAVLGILTGCQTASNQGPIYKLQTPDIQAPAAPVAVSITDKRPPKERSYRRGGVQPAQYQDGIETLTLENFEPQVTEMLKQSFAQKLSTLPVPPVWADVEVTRFRTLIDRREILAVAYERELMQQGGSPPIGLAVGYGGGGQVGVGGVVGAVGSGLMAAAMTARKLDEIEDHRSSWDHALEGVTCEIELHVDLHWQDGRREAFDLQARTHSLPPDEDRLADLMNGMKWDIAATVEQAVIQISDKLQQQGLALVPKVASTPASSLGPALEKLPPPRKGREPAPNSEELEVLPPAREADLPLPTGSSR